MNKCCLALQRKGIVSTAMFSAMCLFFVMPLSLADKVEVVRSVPYLEGLVLEQLLNENASRNERFARQLRHKRGIVLIDEDFDVPPDPGVKQSWSAGKFDNPETTDISLTDKMPRSAVETSTVFATTGELSDKLETIGMLSTDKTGNSTSKISTISVKRKYSNLPISFRKKLELPPKARQELGTAQNTSSAVDPGATNLLHLSEEGSGDDILTNSAETATPSVIKKSTDVSTVHEFVEGSGDDVTRAFITDITTGSVTTPEFMKCLNSTCDSRDLIIQPELLEKIPQGINVSLTCVKTGDAGELRWYRYALGNNASSIGAEMDTNETRYHIAETQVHHSGMYMCVLISEQTCCHRRLEIIVYEVPNYKFHMIVIGLLVGISLVLCIILVFSRRYRTKKPDEKVELQNLEKPF